MTRHHAPIVPSTMPEVTALHEPKLDVAAGQVDIRVAIADAVPA